MSQIIWSQTATKDLNRHYKFINFSNPSTAALAIHAILSSVKDLEENPRRGAIVEEIAGLRKLIVSFGKYSYIIHYVILEDDVIILCVYHGREYQPR
ncbi:MAG: type II toxin-antitoxin system RelE/ParE family toxin [Cyanobacteria bacterium P01_D01_bin.50]